MILEASIVRHGKDKANELGIVNGHLDTPLTIEGEEQAHEAALQLRGRGIETVYTSPLRRARRTAQIIVEDLGLEPEIVHEGLTERHAGMFTGRKIEDVRGYAKRNSLPTLLTYDDRRIALKAEGMESFETTYETARTTLEDISRMHKSGRRVALVTHEQKAAMLIGVSEGLDWEEAVRRMSLPNGGIYDIKFDNRRIVPVPTRAMRFT